MLNVHICSKKKNKKKKNCDLLPLGSLFLQGLNLKRKKKGGGATSVGSRLTGELVPTLTFQGSLTLGQMGLLKFVVMSSHKSLAAYPPTKR